MKRTSWLVAAGLAVTAGVALAAAAWLIPDQRASATPPHSYDGGTLGPVRLWQPDGQPNSMVFLLSDDTGWSPEFDAAAQRLQGNGAFVVGVDLKRYLDGLEHGDDQDCHSPAGDFEELSQRLEREFKFASYHAPIVVGRGQGATIAYGAVAQAAAKTTIEGGASIGPLPPLKTRLPLCTGPGDAPAATPTPGGGFSYGPQPHIPGWWRVGLQQPDPTTSAFATASGGEVLPLPKDAPLADQVVAMLHQDAPADADASAVGSLPLEELQAASPSPTLAIIYSGDGGWQDLDKTIGEALQSKGISVVGVDSLRYFWSERTPEQTAKDLAHIIDHYGKAWGAQRVILIGYSFGANVLPFAYNRLPAAEKAKVDQISLLGLAERTDFEIRVTGWLGVSAADDAPPVAPELKSIDPARIQCFYGEEEDDTVCPTSALAGAEVIKTTGGHHFDGDYDSLARIIMDGATKRQSLAESKTPNH
ncbi:virulence factor family protein [Inquilinus limosus]|uniref:virulence factor family protein n=1 Tax=Inquilinus limosus TaxID=171674 RepID=UPI003F17A27B